jgi:elongation factor Ts
MNISAKDVNHLRQITGAGMMDCKKALIEAEGDIDAAIEVLRKKGQKVSANRSDRDATEGIVFILPNADHTEAVLLELNCETDFVARNQDFQALGNSILELAAAHKPADIDALKELPLNGVTVKVEIETAIGKIGEKIEIGTYTRISGEKVVTYLHPGARIGVAVAFSGLDGKDASDIGREVAMQIAAMSPVSVDKDDVPTEVIQKEIEIGMEQARNEGKPEAMLEKIAQGKLTRYYKDNTLLNQDFVKDPSISVGQHIKNVLGANAKVTGFRRVQLGA